MKQRRNPESASVCEIIVRGFCEVLSLHFL